MFILEQLDETAGDQSCKPEVLQKKTGHSFVIKYQVSSLTPPRKTPTVSSSDDVISES